MPISVNPIFPVIAAQDAAPEPVLQPGTVIDAQVLKILANDLVRIAIANLSIEVLSEIPLQAGQSLQLAVSQTPGGIKLAVVGQGNAAPAASSSEPTLSNVMSPDIVDIAPVAAEISVTNPVPLKDPLTPLQALAVSAAAQAAATRQNSLAPLFANLDAVVRSDVLPPRLQQAVAQILALRPNLDQNLSADDVKDAFENSGLFLESSLASGHAPTSPAGVPDLKAALLVLRQTLQSLGTATSEGAIPQAVAPPQSVRPAQAASDARAVDSASPPLAGSPAFAPSQMPQIEVEEVLLPQARLPVAEDFSQSAGDDHVLSTAPPLRDAGIRAEAVPLGQLRPENSASRAARDDNAAAVHTNVPPPPFRGALPSPQPALPPAIAADAPLAAIVHRLADDTDAAIARQTLLQVASLPDRADIGSPRTEPAAPRWNFEIPFATPAGTAIAQFEIARDGTGRMIDAAKPAWRARFSLDIEPAGPVHALISLAGERTSVRMWAERPATVTQLRAGVSELSRALSRAELQPGDIVIRHGMPAQPSPAPAGHFLDRAL
jgi:Flagellar hook-length control protein FliK